MGELVVAILIVILVLISVSVPQDLDPIEAEGRVVELMGKAGQDDVSRSEARLRLRVELDNGAITFTVVRVSDRIYRISQIGDRWTCQNGVWRRE